MRIIHISEAFGGGLRTAIANYVSSTPQFEHMVYARSRPGHETFELSDSTRCELYVGGLLGFYAGARRAVVDGDFDIVHLHSSFAGVLRAVLPASTRIVYSPHCYPMEADHTSPVRYLYWQVERALARRPQLLVAVSPHEAEIGRHLNASMRSVEIPNAAPLALAALVRPDRDAGRPTVAMLGRICAQKDPAFFAAVVDACKGDYDFLWIGDGIEGRNSLERSGVRITGWIPPSEARQLLFGATLYAHSAAWEGGPLATLEAADAGCPVISRTIPSMESLGYHMAGKTPSQVALAIDRFFADPEYADTVRLSTDRVLSTYTFERMATELNAAYIQALEILGRRRS